MFIQFVIATIAGASLVFWLPNDQNVSVLVQSAINISVLLLTLSIAAYFSLHSKILFKAITKPLDRLYSKPINKKYHQSGNSFSSFFTLLKLSSINYPLNNIVFNSINMGLGFLLGIMLVVWQVQKAPSLDDEWFNKKSVFIGEVVSFPVEEQAAHLHKVTLLLKINHAIGDRLISKKVSDEEANIDSAFHNIPIPQNKLKPTVQSWSFKQPMIKVSWYLSTKQKQAILKSPKLGEKWLFYGKLKTNHASSNFFAHDYEAWLLQKGISGKLSVSGFKNLKEQQIASLLVDKQSSETLMNAMPVPLMMADEMGNHVGLYENTFGDAFTDYLNLVRNNVFNSLQELTEKSPFQAVYMALLMGEKSSIAPAQWQLFQETGTIHLMAISGLHMSIMALIGFLIAKALWWLLVYKQRWMIFPYFSAITSFLFATYYLIISGAAIPTQRAWIMVSTVIVFLVMRRTFQPMSALAMAALLVVLWDVKALLSSGFWLSFLAVWLIFTFLELIKPLGKLHKTLLVQIVLSVGLLPVIAWLYYAVPIYGLIANLIAVPFITFIGLPLLLLAQVLGVFSVELSTQLFHFSDVLWKALFDILTHIQRLPNSLVSVGDFHIWQLVIFYFGWFVLLNIFKVTIFKSLSVSFAAWLSVLILGLYLLLSSLVIIFNKVQAIAKPGEVEITVFDVGQGQAIAFKTLNHLVIYDAGAKWGSNTDAAKIAMLPYFKAQLINDIDVLIISHSDIDHAGGANTLLSELNVHQAISGQPQKLNEILQQNNSNAFFNSSHFKACRAGQEWEFDKVKFSILSPAKDASNLSDNDWSCVLKVSSGKHATLVMGDLSVKAEKKLINQLEQHTMQTTKIAYEPIKPQMPQLDRLDSLQSLSAALLVAGHHGSRYSTSSSLLEAVKPNKVVFSSGYLNRYHFPHPNVLQRLEKYQINQNSMLLSGENSQLNSDGTVNDHKLQLKWWNTACSGALRFRLTDKGVKLENEARKTNARWYHHRCASHQQGRFYQ